MSYEPPNPAETMGFIDPSTMFNMVQRMTQDRRRYNLVNNSLGSGKTEATSYPGAPDRFQSFLSAMSNRSDRMLQ